jgi:hypothetical protein
MTPFVSPTLLAFGPYVVPTLILILAALMGVIVWLLEKPRTWRIGLALLIAFGIALQLAPLVLP